jgi:hypothetical protein
MVKLVVPSTEIVGWLDEDDDEGNSVAETMAESIFLQERWLARLPDDAMTYLLDPQEMMWDPHVSEIKPFEGLAECGGLFEIFTIRSETEAQEIGRIVRDRGRPPEWPTEKWIESGFASGHVTVARVVGRPEMAGFSVHSRRLSVSAEDGPQVAYCLDIDSVFVNRKARGLGLSQVLSFAVGRETAVDMEHMVKLMRRRRMRGLGPITRIFRSYAEFYSKGGASFCMSVADRFEEAVFSSHNRNERKLVHEAWHEEFVQREMGW